MSDILPQYGTPSPALGAWAASLQPASWRGVPFAVEVDTYRGGRRIALHEYPYRDDPWPEDTGRATRRITITGFLLGDDVFDQRAALIAALEQQGPGTLIHPSFGSITATLDGDFTIGQRKELGRVLQVEFGVIQTGAAQPLYPVADASTQDNAEAAADTCDATCGSDFISDVTAALASGEAVVAGAVGTVAGFVATVVGSAATVALAAEQVLALPAVVVGSALAAVGELSGLVNDAGLIAGAAVGLVGNFGRYATGALTAPLPASATIASQIDALTISRAAVGSVRRGAGDGGLGAVRPSQFRPKCRRIACGSDPQPGRSTPGCSSLWLITIRRLPSSGTVSGAR